MIASLGAKEEVQQTSTEYHYLSSQSHPYYYSVPFNDDSNNPHHYRPSIYETNQYYSLSNQECNHYFNDKGLTNYRPTYYQHCSPEEHANDSAYPSKVSGYHSMSIYDYTSPSSNCVPPLNSGFNQHLSYAPVAVESMNCNTDETTNYSTPYTSSDGTCRSDSVFVELLNRPLWLKFAAHTHENVVTKPGRRMFPTLEFKVSGLKPEATYDICIEMVLLDLNHWKFNSGKWIASEQSEPGPKNSHRYLHPDSPSSGEQWMKSSRISFSKLKLTNNKKLSTGHSQNQMPLLLHSMHKYIPRLSIIQTSNEPNDTLSSLPKYTFTFPETQFIAVTAYQNTDITQLKIDNNPFAKGFRENADNQSMHSTYPYSRVSPSDDRRSNTSENDCENVYEHSHLPKKRRHY